LWCGKVTAGSFSDGHRHQFLKAYRLHAGDDFIRRRLGALCRECAENERQDAAGFFMRRADRAKKAKCEIAVRMPVVYSDSTRLRPFFLAR
jgi:hypothetical protein